jgi:rubrerythrin
MGISTQRVRKVKHDSDSEMSTWECQRCGYYMWLSTQSEKRVGPPICPVDKIELVPT